MIFCSGLQEVGMMNSSEQSRQHAVPSIEASSLRSGRANLRLIRTVASSGSSRARLLPGDLGSSSKRAAQSGPQGPRSPPGGDHRYRAVVHPGNQPAEMCHRLDRSQPACYTNGGDAKDRCVSALVSEDLRCSMPPAPAIGNRHTCLMVTPSTPSSPRPAPG